MPDASPQPSNSLQPQPQVQPRVQSQSRSQSQAPPAQPTKMENGSNTPIADLSSVPTTVRPGGAPARVYLNDKIVPHLLEGMKTIARDQPSNPLRVLGEYLIQKSEEVEGDSKKEGES